MTTRVLVTACPLFGHVNTVLPLAVAAQRAGHDVVVATGADLVPHVARRGLPTWPVGPTHAEAGVPDSPRWFARTGARRAADLMPLAAAWRPDLVVHEETELRAGGRRTARRAARHARARDRRVRAVGAVRGRRRGGRRARGDPRPAGPDAGRGVPHPVPARSARRGTRTTAAARPASSVRAGRPGGRAARADGRAAARADGAPHARHGVPPRRRAGGRDRRPAPPPGELVVTAGPDVDPDRFGPQPPHVLVERYVPHALLLPRCDLVVSQGGAGILLGALAHGLPQLVLPQAADQPANADAVERAGAALVLRDGEVTAGAVRAAAERLLDRPRYRAAARAVASEIADMPTAEQVVAALLPAAVV